MIHSKVSSGWSSVMAFKGNGGGQNIGEYGDRTPAVFYHNGNGHIYVMSSVSGNKDYGFHCKIDLGTWHHVEIVQKLVDRKVADKRLTFQLASLSLTTRFTTLSISTTRSWVV